MILSFKIAFTHRNFFYRSMVLKKKFKHSTVNWIFKKSKTLEENMVKRSPDRKLFIVNGTASHS